MDPAEQKVAQYLSEAHATETTLIDVLSEQIAVAPRGEYRSGLETHLRETRDHAQRLERRLREIDGSAGMLEAVSGLAQSIVGQALALAKSPIDLLRGSGGEEKVLKNAKDACATEALEIATYTALERVATSVDDDQTAKLAASIRADEERMLDKLLGIIPKLAEGVVAADVRGDRSYKVSETGAGEAAEKTAEKAAGAVKRGARQARKVPGVAQAEGQAKGAAASEGDLPISNYDSLNANEIVQRLSGLSQIDLAKIDSYERRHDNRSTVLDRITSLRGDEPWPGYDEQNVSEIEKVLAAGGEDQARKAREYERSHKNRTGVLKAAESHAGD